MASSSSTRSNAIMEPMRPLRENINNTGGDDSEEEGELRSDDDGKERRREKREKRWRDASTSGIGGGGNGNGVGLSGNGDRNGSGSKSRYPYSHNNRHPYPPKHTQYPSYHGSNGHPRFRHPSHHSYNSHNSQSSHRSHNSYNSHSNYGSERKHNTERAPNSLSSLSPQLMQPRSKKHLQRPIDTSTSSSTKHEKNDKVEKSEKGEKSEKSDQDGTPRKSNLGNPNNVGTPASFGTSINSGSTGKRSYNSLRRGDFKSDLNTDFNGKAQSHAIQQLRRPSPQSSTRQSPRNSPRSSPRSYSPQPSSPQHSPQTTSPQATSPLPSPQTLPSPSPLPSPPSSLNYSPDVGDDENDGGSIGREPAGSRRGSGGDLTAPAKKPEDRDVADGKLGNSSIGGNSRENENLGGRNAKRISELLNNDDDSDDDLFSDNEGDKIHEGSEQISKVDAAGTALAHDSADNGKNTPSNTLTSFPSQSLMEPPESTNSLAKHGDGEPAIDYSVVRAPPQSAHSSIPSKAPLLMAKAHKQQHDYNPSMPLPTGKSSLSTPMLSSDLSATPNDTSSKAVLRSERPNAAPLFKTASLPNITDSNSPQLHAFNRPSQSIPFQRDPRKIASSSSIHTSSNQNLATAQAVSLSAAPPPSIHPSSTRMINTNLPPPPLQFVPPPKFTPPPHFPPPPRFAPPPHFAPPPTAPPPLKSVAAVDSLKMAPLQSTPTSSSLCSQSNLPPAKTVSPQSVLPSTSAPRSRSVSPKPSDRLPPQHDSHSNLNTIHDHANNEKHEAKNDGNEKTKAQSSSTPSTTRFKPSNPSKPPTPSPPNSPANSPQHSSQTQSKPQSQPKPSPSPPPDAEYTESLHWKRPTSLTMHKRPIALPSDVEHIAEVEWADEPHAPSHYAKHQAHFLHHSSHTTTSHTTHNDHTPSHSTSHKHTHSSSSTTMPPQIPNNEKAPRPKTHRPEPCFCEPNVHSQEMCCVDESCALFACQEECPTNCPAGPLCGNKRIQRREWKKLQVFDAGLKGRGLMVLDDCQKGDFICEYVGVAVKRQYLDGLFQRYKNERMLYIMALDGDVYIDARHRGGIARYINHSCEPNCAVHRWRVRGIIRAGVFALREIHKGEELSFDYQWDRKRGRALTKCYCGSALCRGTLEIPKDCEEQELEDQLEGHWILPKNPKAGHEIVNRVIKVYFDDNEEYYVADVAQYNAETGKHQLMYRGDMEDYWTDLAYETWMILDEEGERYAIAKKDRSEEEGESLLSHTLSMASPNSDSMSRSSSPLPSSRSRGTKVKNYLLVQTPVKDAMTAKHTFFKCGRFCRVHVDVVHLTVRDRHEGDDEELKMAMDESEDGSVWKLVVTGMEPTKAIDYLNKVANIVRNTMSGVMPMSDTAPSTTSGPPAVVRNHHTEMIIPRVIVDSVKKRFYTMKTTCYNVDLTFTHSDSKSKQFAKMMLASDLGSDMERALEYLNNEITQLCLSASAPMTSIGVYKDFAYLAGELSNDDFHLLFETRKIQTKSTDCNEDLQGSNFAAAFEEGYRCSIWVQAEEDMGRVANNRIINESNPNKPRQLFFGVNPSRVTLLWTYIQNRIADLKKGVQFLNLGPDRIYQPSLLEPIKRNSRRQGCNYFFDFVHLTTGASVRIDSVTPKYLRIDGGDASISEEAAQQANRRITTAKELISLQIELLRDHHIRQQRWGFGRDWALLLESDSKSKATTESSNQDHHFAANSKGGAMANYLRLSDPRSLGNVCLEMSDIVAGMGLSEGVAAHACIIFYRYVSLPSSANSLTTIFKLRDIELASLFIANKSQKVMKWKRLEFLMEQSYRVFYPGSFFNPESEEAQNWERRVITAEKSILVALNYDVFWPGVDWVVSAVVGTKAMAEPLAENAMKLALSGHVLASGPVLWLKYGPKYAFAAIAGLLSIDIEPLFPALSLLPLTVSHAAELIYTSCQALSRAKKSSSLHSSRHEMFSDSQVSIMGKKIQKIQKDCATYMSKCKGSTLSDTNFVSSPAFNEISHRANSRRVFRNVAEDCLEKNILPILGKICFESKCTIRFSEGFEEGTNDVVLEGSWKALAIAEHFFCEAVSASPSATVVETTPKYTAQDYFPLSESSSIKQVKVQPGLLEMKEVDTNFGWEGTVDLSSVSNSSGAYDAGWKTCVAAKAPQEQLDSAGLRWWVPPQYGPSISGSLCEIFASPKLLNSGRVDMNAVALLAQSFTGGYSSLASIFPTLASFLLPPEDSGEVEESRSIAVSLQRWPPEKIEMKEASYAEQRMQMGFSVAALQEMQLLHQLHFLIPSPQGHPNFILPLAIALDSDSIEDRKESTQMMSTSSNKSGTERTDVNSILAMIEGNKRVSKKKRTVSGSHLVLEPTPLVLQKVMNHFQRKNNAVSTIPPSVLASWCHDILSAISFCHSNHIILRSLLPDQIHIDHSGTAKLSGLSKVMVLHGNDRKKDFDPLKYVRVKKGKEQNFEDVEPFAAPELVLGGTRYTKETDMWAFGSLFANLLLGKQLFPGRDRVSKMMNTFKVIGVPAGDNFSDAERFPFYSNKMLVGDEKKKRYKRGVDKALRHFLKAFGSNPDDYSGLIDLIDKMLHLDPKKRISADQALNDKYMVQHVSNVENEAFRQKYVNDWLDLKKRVLSKGSKSKRKNVSDYNDIDVPFSTSHINLNGRIAENELKRKSLLLEASSGDGDEMYSFDDTFSAPTKKSKLFDK